MPYNESSIGERGKKMFIRTIAETEVTCSEDYAFKTCVHKDHVVALADCIEHMFQLPDPNKVRMIKMVREFLGVGLRESKAFVDNLNPNRL